jgi:hypothetical protein
MYAYLDVREDLLDLVGGEDFGGLTQVALKLVQQTLLVTIGIKDNCQQERERESE